MAGPTLTPDQAMRLAKNVADIYAQASAQLIQVVARRVSKGVAEPALASTRAQLTELLALRKAAEAVVARAQAAGGSKTIGIVEQAYRGGLRASPSGLVAVNQRSVRAIAEAALGEIDRAGPAMLRWADDVYRQVLADTAPLAVTGALTRRQAAARALDRFAAMGVNQFTDSSGARWRIESYVEMATRTATQRAHLAGTIDRLTGQGRDLVIVTTSPAGCPLCRPHEGHVFSLSGNSREYPPLAEATGLFHPNCTHTVTAYVPGLTRDPKPKEPSPSTEGYRGARHVDDPGSVDLTNLPARPGADDHSDAMLSELMQRQGYGKPRIVGDADYDAAVTGGGTPIFRGLNADEATTARWFDDFAEGESPFVGLGVYGNGHYFARSAEVAKSYAGGSGRVIEAVLDPKARVLDWDDDKMNAIKATLFNEPKERAFVLWDPGRYATAHGYDAIRVATPRGEYVVVLNRSALVMKGR